MALRLGKNADDAAEGILAVADTAMERALHRRISDRQDALGGVVRVLAQSKRHRF